MQEKNFAKMFRATGRNLLDTKTVAVLGKTMPADRSDVLFKRARQKIPGGVNSPVRAWNAVGGSPRFIARGGGSRIYDVNRRVYIDYVCSWGPLILGHAHPKIVKTVQKALANGASFGAPTEREIELAESVSRQIPSIEKLRLVSSGTEATMSALRLARGFTKRTRIVKFDGCYHGHVDALLARSGSGVASFSLPDSVGVPPAFAAETSVATFNDIAGLEALFARYPESIAAVIVEPICGNMGVIPPAPGFLEKLAGMTRKHRALLIFDEVITGFRVSAGGAQDLFNIRPDLTCLGKILGGGLPLGAFGGRAEIMDLLAPEGPVYQAGTLSGNPLAVAAGLATLKELSRRGAYKKLEEKGKKVEDGFRNVLKAHRIPGVVNRQGSMLTLFFGVERVRNAADARRSDKERFARFFHGMLERGIYWPPSQFEAAFVSLAHSLSDIDKTVQAFDHWARGEAKG
jgi:glutamate-1-semialdehyde 2,1-aminomutase